MSYELEDLLQIASKLPLVQRLENSKELGQFLCLDDVVDSVVRLKLLILVSHEHAHCSKCLELTKWTGMPQRLDLNLTYSTSVQFK